MVNPKGSECFGPKLKEKDAGARDYIGGHYRGS